MNPEFRKALVAWYADNARDLPWRRNPTPYRVWVSEIMLQQTRVEAVRDYFTRFIKRFPTVASLAAADEEDVLEAWSGLGYYRRARMLHAAARQVVALHGGRFPAQRNDVLALPGIGRYTAGAILSIAFNQPQPIVDGNVQRVFARIAASTQDAWEFAETHVQQGAAEGLRPSDLNQALMELGAATCTPQATRCGDCPVQAHCRAFRAGTVDRFPAPKQRTRPRSKRYLFAAIHDARGRVLMVRRPAIDKSSLLPGGLWELPHRQWSRGKSATLAALAGELALSCEPQGRPVTQKHSIMNYRLTLTAQRCTTTGKPAHGRWFTPAQARNAAIASATRKLLEAL